MTSPATRAPPLTNIKFPASRTAACVMAVDLVATTLLLVSLLGAVVFSALALTLQARGFLAVCLCMSVLSNETPTFVGILIFNDT